jgi:hypothetical protein
MSDNKFSGEIGHLSPDDTAAYQRAVDIYRALSAVLNALIDQETDPEVAARLNATAAKYAGEQRQLAVTDRAAIRRVIDQYPAVIKQLRATLDR